jgi:hypothetical protein
MAQQRARIGRARGHGGGDAGGVETGTGAHLARSGIVDDQHPHRPVALGLQDEAAFEFQRRPQQYGQHDGLAQELGHGDGVVVPRQDGVDGGTEAHHAAAQVERLDLERQDGVVGGGGRRCADRDFELGLGLGHDRLDIRGRGGKLTPCRRPDCARRGTADGGAAGAQCAFRHQARMPFWACRRFSASSNTTDCGPSMTSSVTSSPRWAGRQCMNTASGFARAISRALTW